MVEMALIAPVLFALVFGVVDLGRAAQLQNRLSTAAREGSSYAQFHPTRVDCPTGSSVLQRAIDAEDSLASVGGFEVTVAERATPGGPLVAYSGCGTATGKDPGDRVVVTVRAELGLLTPFAASVVDNPLQLSRSSEVTVQG